MSTFRNEIEVELDGEVFKAKTRAIDYTNAEQQISKEGHDVTQTPVALRFRVAWLAFRRAFPDDDRAKAFGRFMDALDDISEEADRDGMDPLDPTQTADSEG